MILKDEMIGGQRLILGDCMDVMPLLGKVDAVVTDPPYELSKSGPGNSHFGMSLGKFDTKAYKDIVDGVDYELLFSHMERICKPMNGFAFCSNKQISKIMSKSEDMGLATTLLVWHKVNAAPFANGVWRGDIEYIIHFRGKGATFNGNATEKTKVIPHPLVQDKRHPTVKPIPVIGRLLINCSNAGDKILDPFMGSGTTLVACQRMGRNGIGIERDPDYFEIACRRVEEEANQVRIFDEPEDPRETFIQEDLL